MTNAENSAAASYNERFASFIFDVASKIPTAYQVHKAPQRLPYVVWYEEKEKAIHADGKIIYKAGTIKIELYARLKDISAEQTVDEIFKKHYYHSGYFEKEQHFIASEQCKCIIYSMNVKKES